MCSKVLESLLVDMQDVAPTSGGKYYPDHLPVLGKIKTTCMPIGNDSYPDFSNMGIEDVIFIVSYIYLKVLHILHQRKVRLWQVISFRCSWMWTYSR